MSTPPCATSASWQAEISTQRTFSGVCGVGVRCSFGFSLLVLHKYAAEIAISAVIGAYVIGIIGRGTRFRIYIFDVSAVAKHTHSERVLSFQRIPCAPNASSVFIEVKPAISSLSSMNPHSTIDNRMQLTVESPLEGIWRQPTLIAHKGLIAPLEDPRKKIADKFRNTQRGDIFRTLHPSRSRTRAPSLDFLVRTTVQPTLSSSRHHRNIMTTTGDELAVRDDENAESAVNSASRWDRRKTCSTRATTCFFMMCIQTWQSHLSTHLFNVLASTLLTHNCATMTIH